MLPFLKNRQEASVSAPVDIQKRKPDEGQEPEYDSMHAAAEDLINAIHAKDVQGVAEALRAAHDLAGSPEGEE